MTANATGLAGLIMMFSREYEGDVTGEPNAMDYWFKKFLEQNTENIRLKKNLFLLQKWIKRVE